MLFKYLRLDSWSPIAGSFGEKFHQDVEKFRLFNFSIYHTYRSSYSILSGHRFVKNCDIFSIKKTIFFSCAFIYKTDVFIHFLGRDPTGLTMAVVNGENSDQCQYYTDGNYLIIPIPYNF